MRSVSLALSAASLMLQLAGCETHYAYIPRTTSTTVVAGRVTAEYSVPPEAPRGSVRITSYGIVDVAPTADAQERLRALHLRVVVANDSDKEWTFDTREQRIDLRGHGISAPAFASANLGSAPPVVAIAPSGRRVVDLFFVLPADLQGANDLPAFDAIWRVNAGASVIAQTTPFERLRAEPVEQGGPDDYGPDYYWGPPYWYNPYYPRVTFVRPVFVPHHFVLHPFIFHRGPSRGHFHGGGHR